MAYRSSILNYNNITIQNQQQSINNQLIIYKKARMKINDFFRRFFFY